MMKPVGKIDGRPASLVLEGMKTGSPSPSLPVSPSPGLRPPVTRTAGGELVQPGTPMNPNARWQKPGAPVTPSVTRNAPVTPKSVTPPVTPLSPQQEKQFTALGQAHQLSQASQGPMPRVTPTSAMPPKFVAPPSGFSPEFHRQFDPVTSTPQPAVTPATPPLATPTVKAAPPARLDAAQTQAVKNPQGLSARMNPPGARPVPLAQDPIAKPVIAGLTAVGQAVSSTGGMISTALKSQAARNPQGIAAKIGGLLGR